MKGGILAMECEDRYGRQMDCLLSFSHAPCGSFLVLLESASTRQQVEKPVTLTAFPDENEFIQSVILSLSDNEAIMSVIAHVLLDVSGRQVAGKWLSIDLPQTEVQAMGLALSN